MNNSSEKLQAPALEPPAKQDQSEEPLSKSPQSDTNENSNLLPERYVVKTRGEERMLICLEAPNLYVHIEADLSIAASVARKSPNGTIFLDGVAQCEPFMDHEHQIYNLDHHEGCVRAFTLSTCEQTLVMYMKGLDLQSREWNIFANEPDLDTLLAIWIILNHARIGQQDATQRRILFALVRFEGVIDALGLELKEFCALPLELMKKIQRVIDHLRSTEIALKRENSWIHYDYLDYAVEILHKIDHIFYKSRDFADYHGVHELARIDLTEQRIAAVVEADMGIYEIEPHLNKVYGNRLGVVFLKKGDNAYTVRKMDLFMPITLEEIYDRLNFVDAAVKCNLPARKWGGAADIGGSPRDSGTRLTPVEILQACYETIRKPSLLRQMYHFLSTTVLMTIITLCAYFTQSNWHPELWYDPISKDSLWASPYFGFITTLGLLTAVSLFLTAGKRLWQYGWTCHLGKTWWFLLPISMVGGLIGGVWSPPQLARMDSWVHLIGLGILGMPIAVELLFRSLGHGLLARNAVIPYYDSKWFISWPNFASSVLYALFVCFFLNTLSMSELSRTIWVGIGAMLVGLSTAMARERSHSIWPAMVFHILAAGLSLTVLRYL